LKLENLAPKEEKADEPSAEAQELERLRKENEAYVAQERERQARENETRLSQLEQSMRERYQAVRQAPGAPVAEPIYQAKQELGITDEQLLEKPSEMVAKIVAHQVAQARAEDQAQVAQVLRHQVERGYDSEMASLQSHPYFDDVAPVLREHFEANPQEKIEAGSVKRRFNELVGANIETLTQLAAEREAKRKMDEDAQRHAEQPGAISRNRVVEPAIRAGSAPPVEAPKEKGETELDPDPARAAEKRRLIDAFNRYGANLDEAEFVGIESGQVFEKKVAADIQLGRGKPNVEY